MVRVALFGVLFCGLACASGDSGPDADSVLFVAGD
jgi:hypothetical protein